MTSRRGQAASTSSDAATIEDFTLHLGNELNGFLAMANDMLSVKTQVNKRFMAGTQAMVVLLTFSRTPEEYHQNIRESARLAGGQDASATRGYAVKLVNLHGGPWALVAPELLQSLQAWIFHQSGDFFASRKEEGPRPWHVFVDPLLADFVSCRVDLLPKKHKVYMKKHKDPVEIPLEDPVETRLRATAKARSCRRARARA